MGLALCDEARSMLSLLRAGTTEFVHVPLAPLSDPVGAVFFEGKVYVACFGSATTSGLAVVDPFTHRLEATHAFPHDGSGRSFVHNVYVFDWRGKPEVFVAVLGNPWASPPVPGKGLVRFDRKTSTFLTGTTTSDLNARSAVQQSQGVFYAITQEPHGGPTQLARLERQGEALAVTARASLPARSGGDGGADVLLGFEPDTVFCTDRTSGLGKLYYYTFGAGAFHLASVRDTGKNPRHATIRSGSGDVVVSNKGDATLTVFEGLALHPTSASIVPVTASTVPEVSFFIGHGSSFH